jgi:uncharacterized protein YqjF (DUF2071 family)
MDRMSSSSEVTQSDNDPPATDASIRPDSVERQRYKQRDLRRRAIGYQRWHEILFVHWSVPMSVVGPLVDSRLDIDTSEGDLAWITETPFTLVGGRLRGLPPLPKVSTFHELNLRTYVHLRGREPGVWFFTLDAASRLASMLARAVMALPYHPSHMHRWSEGRFQFYESRRAMVDFGGRTERARGQLAGLPAEPVLALLDESWGSPGQTGDLARAMAILRGR